MDNITRNKVCNICGGAFTLYDAVDDCYFTKLLGFGTKYDGKCLDLHICANCLERLIDSCAVNPTYDPYPEVTEAEERLAEAYEQALSGYAARV